MNGGSLVGLAAPLRPAFHDAGIHAEVDGVEIARCCLDGVVICGDFRDGAQNSAAHHSAAPASAAAALARSDRGTDEALDRFAPKGQEPVPTSLRSMPGWKRLMRERRSCMTLQRGERDCPE